MAENRTKKSVKDSRSASFIRSCGRLDMKTDDSFFLNLFKKLSLNRRFLKPVKYAVTRAKDESMIIYGLSYLGKTLLSLDILNYGTFLLLFSITSFLSECARLLIDTNSILGIDYSFVIQSFVLFIASLFLIFGGRNKSLSEGILGSRIVSFFTFKLFGVRKESVKTGQVKSGLLYMILLGVFFGVLTLQFSQTDILYRIMLVILGVIILVVPESGIVMTLLAAPFLDDMKLMLLTIFVWLCFTLKLFWGKRSLKLTFTDLTVVVFALTVLLAGVVGIGHSEPQKGIVGMVLILSFVLVSTLIRNRAWIDRCRLAITISTVTYGLISVVGTGLEYVLDKILIDPMWMAYIPADIPVVTKETGYFLLLGIFFVFAFFRTNDKTLGRFNMLLLSAVLTLGVFLTYSWQIWLAFIIGAVIYLVYTKPKLLYVLLPIVAIITAVLIILPNTVIESVINFAGFSADEFSNIVKLNDVLARISLDNLWGGIGLSENTFRYYLWDSNADSANHDLGLSNTFLLMLLQLGILGVLLFVFIFLLVVGSYTVWGRSPKADKSLSSVGISGISMFISIVLLGCLEYVFSSISVSLIFWMAGGIVYASCKVMKDEACGLEEEEPVVYYVEKRKTEVKKVAECGKEETEI